MTSQLIRPTISWVRAATCAFAMVDPCALVRLTLIIISGSYIGLNDPAGGGYSLVGFEGTSGYSLRWVSQHVYTDGFGQQRLAERYSSYSIDSEVGLRYTFRVLFISSCNCLRAYINTVLWSSSIFNPFNNFDSGWGSGPWSPRFYSLTGYKAASVPGTPSAKVPFTALGAQRVSDGAVVQMPCTMFRFNQKASNWGADASSCDSTTVWTITP